MSYRTGRPADQREPIDLGAHQRNEDAERVRDAGPELLAALKAVLERDRQRTCLHEETYRGGAIWEICHLCGVKWADDQGGKPADSAPKEWAQAESAITSAEPPQ